MTRTYEFVSQDVLTLVRARKEGSTDRAAVPSVVSLCDSIPIVSRDRTSWPAATSPDGRGTAVRLCPPPASIGALLKKGSLAFALASQRPSSFSINGVTSS